MAQSLPPPPGQKPFVLNTKAVNRKYCRYELERLRRHPEFVLSWFFKGFEESARFVTLTFSPYCRTTEETRSNTFREFMKRLNRAVYGSQFLKHGKRLCCLPVLEESKGGSHHIHALISTPDNFDLLRPGESFDELIVRLWTKLRLTGVAKAQYSTTMYDLENVSKYITKDLKRPWDYANLDVMNIYR